MIELNPHLADVLDKDNDVIYVSGPMSKIEEYNIPLFREVTAALRAEGYVVFPAHEVSHADNGKPGSLAWEQYMRGDLISMLTHCNAILMLPGWEDSDGAKVERGVAMSLHYKYYELKVA